MDARDTFLDAFERIKGSVHQELEGLSEEDLVFQPGPKANTIAWLAWHLTRVQDDHVSEVARTEQSWVAGGWSEVFGLGLDVWDIGYGHKVQQVLEVKASSEHLVAYHDDVYQRTRRYLSGVTADALDMVVDRRYDPPVTLGVRLLSVVFDCFQHLGQIGYVKGLLPKRPDAG